MSMIDHIASLTISDLLKPKPQGEYVNGHVVQAAREPSPDYEAMRRVVSPAPVVPNQKDERLDP